MTVSYPSPMPARVGSLATTTIVLVVAGKGTLTRCHPDRQKGSTVSFPPLPQQIATAIRSPLGVTDRADMVRNPDLPFWQLANTRVIRPLRSTPCPCSSTSTISPSAAKASMRRSPPRGCHHPWSSGRPRRHPPAGALTRPPPDLTGPVSDVMTLTSAATSANRVAFSAARVRRCRMRPGILRSCSPSRRLSGKCASSGSRRMPII